ncbi:MAG: PEP/pyruvate-binding domain-containing protein [Solirubrobacterales bacterium]
MNSRTTTDIRELGASALDDEAVAGHKAAILGQLKRAGLPVPPGFVVGAEDYRSFIGTTGLRGRILERLSDLDIHDLVELENASVHIRGEIVNAEIPGGIEEAMTAAYRELGSPLVAVRSSSTSEHAPSVSFAGMLETRMHVLGEVEVIRSVKHCWSSLFTARNIRYSHTHGRSALTTGIAAIVQRQVDPAKAGTLLTTDPVTGDPDHILIEASLGLGESVTGGSVSPDRFVFGRAENALLASKVPHKEYVVDRNPGDGTAIHEIAGERQDAPVLSDLEIRLLVELGLKTEEILGSPQSIEWAIDHDNVAWVIQARPAPRTSRAETGSSDAPGTVDSFVRGECAMVGTVTGEVRVVASPADATGFKSGEILVARDLLPEWTPLMQSASAVVTDFGGQTSHAATVARELEIPCVVGTKAATTALKTGELVTVDARAGLITPA